MIYKIKYPPLNGSLFIQHMGLNVNSKFIGLLSFIKNFNFEQYT